MDRITVLPENLIYNILKRLPLTDAVRTSILSTAWKFRWTKLSALVLDESFYSSLCKATKLCSSAAYRDILNSLLLQHSGSVETLNMFIPYDKLPNGAYFNHPIRFLLRTGIKTLNIVKIGSEMYLLPRVIFSSVQLTSLSLQNCYFDPPYSFGGLPNLTQLRIRSPYTTADKISSFVSGCPQLLLLFLTQFNFPDDNLDIHAPKLIRLAVGGVFKSVSLRNAKNIYLVRIYLHNSPDKIDWRASDSMPNFFLDMAKLQEAEFGNRFNKVKLLATSGALVSVPRLQKLRELTFHDVYLHDADEAHCLSRLLENAPELKKLKISLKVKDLQATAGFDMDITEFFKKCSLDCLQKVELDNITGTKLELKLLELLLACSRALERMCVTFGEMVETDEKLSAMMQLLSFCRASIKAKVVVNV